MRGARPIACFVLAGAALALGPAACAGLVGADFGDEHLGTASVGNTDGGIQSEIDSSVAPPASDGGIKLGDAAIPVIPADGGACPSGLTDCTGFCVDLSNDPSHCGKCATACPEDPHGAGVCVTSHCTFACDEGWVECAGGCCGTGTDASSTVDSAPPPTDGATPDPGIACGTAYCPVATNSFCCGNNNPGDLCDTDLQDNCPVEIFCDNAAECGGSGVCCYDEPTTQTLCETSCSGNQKQLCNPAAAGECASGTQCTGTFTPSETQYSSCE